MLSFNMALVQMRCEKGAIGLNLKAMKEYIKTGGEKGCQLVAFPEMNLTGYINPVERPDAILQLDSEPVREVIDWSRAYSMAVVFGFVERSPFSKPYITQVAAIDGKPAAIYRKIHVADDEREWFAPGKEPAMFTFQGTSFGLAICADIDASSLFEHYAKHGVQIVLECAAPGLYGEQSSRNWHSGYNWWRSKCHDQLAAYAKAYGLYIGVSTQAGRTVDEDFPGGGYLFTPNGMFFAKK
ncbi:carbon-nitrogen hydrolase family protein [Paenibacillus senegalensis]|uniref:carbon-nitrogen hydrolase family protein n=1 Tax=Paenibacillus senegalensis TaxID=1465766 RepID=UPI000287E255|nr:carbon-nitrogen hydrolase family protein [Paenibacillus senegalensis]